MTTPGRNISDTKLVLVHSCLCNLSQGFNMPMKTACYCKQKAVTARGATASPFNSLSSQFATVPAGFLGSI